MPELPEVETIVRRLRPQLLGRKVLALEARWPKALHPSEEQVRRACGGREIQQLGRRGKHALLGFSGGGWLLIHLRMSGRLEIWSEEQPPWRHARTLWRLDDGRWLVMDDARKFGRVLASREPEGSLAHLGPEPLDPAFTAERFQAMLAARRRALKPLLLDQAFLAGLGNIYADESLFRAGIHPLAKAAALKPAESRELHRRIQQVLREAIEHNGTSIDWIYPSGSMQDYLRVYGRAGEPCVRCGASIQRMVVAQRGTWICPRCQRTP